MYFPQLLKNKKIWLAFGLLCVHVRGLFLDVMDVDAAQYASISREMAENGQWLQVMHRGTDYLDKPPLIFWLSALSFKVFGVSNWSYKLPSFLAAILGVLATYKFSRIFYSRQIAENASLILASCLGFFIMTNDIRTDTLLLAMTACAVWQLAEYLRDMQWKYLISASFFIGLAMLAKGPIGLVVPCFAIGSHLLLRGEWKMIFRWQWLLGLGVVALVLLPMCWGLYHQFDLHPEKPLNDRKTTSGLYFFFWEQSFGRVTGENVWQDDSTPLYFVHTYLWAFLPWALLLAGGLYSRLARLFMEKLPLAPREEAFSMGGFVLSFAALSLSKYKLPHYIFVTLPWASVVVAQYLEKIFDQKIYKSPRTPIYWAAIQSFIFLVMAFIAFYVIGYVFFSENILIWAILVTIFGGVFYAVLKSPVFTDSQDVVLKNILASIGVGFVLNFWFYPNLLPFQGSAKIGCFIKEQKIPVSKIGTFYTKNHTLDFYSNACIKKLGTTAQVRKDQTLNNLQWLVTNETGKMKLDSAGIRYLVKDSALYFQVARLNGEFINPKTRKNALDVHYLIHLSKTDHE